MKIAVPREVKRHEYRVGLTPDNVAALARREHTCFVQRGAGEAIGFPDAEYRDAGAILTADSESLWRESDLVVKVKEPQSDEWPLLKTGQLLFCYLHLAADRGLTEALMRTGATCIAYETVSDGARGLPLLAPMSEVAGRMAVQAGIHHLENPQGGPGLLIGGVSGIVPASVVVLGGGVVGTQAARMASGLGARVTVMDIAAERLRELDQLFMGRVHTRYASRHNIAQTLQGADLVIGAVLVSGAAAPKVVTRAMLREMKDGAVIVDVAIDQGGCVETSRPTSHDAPTFVEEGVTHYCVANIPGAVARTATEALNNASFPHVECIADGGLEAALSDPRLREGINIHAGQLYQAAVAETFGLPATPLADLRQ